MTSNGMRVVALLENALSSLAIGRVSPWETVLSYLPIEEYLLGVFTRRANVSFE